MEKLENRKKDHIDLAFKSQSTAAELDRRFHYEPLLAAHPGEAPASLDFLGKKMGAPLWVSSMTGGTKLAGTINRNLARACNEFGMGMGLGSCRIIMEDERYLPDFQMRPIIGDAFPLWANLGIAQVEELLENKSIDKASRLVETLSADGLIIHVNPMQEWFQPEGDRLLRPPIDTIEEFREKFPFPLIVKEVGQGMGPESLARLLQLPVEAIEFAAFGGTNFARVELLRDEEASKELFTPLAHIGNDALDMVLAVNEAAEKQDPVCRQIIISGGVRDFLDGYYLMGRSRLPSIYGMASNFLRHAREGYEPLQEYVRGQLKGLALAQAYLSIREQ